MKKYIAIFFALLMGASAMALELPEQFGDNMMLQQQTNAKIWGWAKPGSQVSVLPSWTKSAYTAKADKKSGRWELSVETPAASYEPVSLKVNGDGQTITLSNVLIGEVWFCSGQSNMEMPLQGFWNCPVEGSNEAIAMAGRYKRSIRVCTIPKVGQPTPADRVAGKWQECTPANAPLFSAGGYFFAETLTNLLDVPVGIINCSWGGSCVEGWLPKEILETYPDGLTPFNPNDYMQKMVMYNGMLYPLAGYTVKGFLWNQGESNIDREKEYGARFQTMIGLWRKLWNDDTLPVYFVELPGYSYGDVNGTNCADFRAVQHEIAHQLPYSGCVCTADLMLPYEAEQIHGAKKREIGQRLAYMAASRNYGMTTITAEAPEFDHITTQGDTVNIYFKHCTDGFDRLADIEHFEAAGADGVWHEATVWADSEWRNTTTPGCFLRLTCPAAGTIKNVRYHYHNFISGGLRGSRGLPVVPFCTKCRE